MSCHVVAFTGAQGVGKSTLVAAVNDELLRLGVSTCTVHSGLGEEASRNGVPLGKSATASTIMEFARLHSRRERALGSGIHLLDRCFVDLLAYAHAVCGEQRFLIGLIDELTRASMKRTDLVIRVALTEKFSECRSSNESPEVRSQIDEITKALLPVMEVKYLELDCDAVQENAKQVIKCLIDNSIVYSGGNCPNTTSPLVVRNYEGR